MSRLHTVVPVAAASILAVPVVDAHHSITANFDTGREVEIRGVVVDFNYVSPHANMVIEGIGYENGVALNEKTITSPRQTGAHARLANTSSLIRVIGRSARTASEKEYDA